VLSPRHASYKRHGGSSTRTYRIWKKMIERCSSPKHDSYRKYGARGITVCDRWRYDFAAFRADMGEVSSGLSLDRIDNNGNYEPGNCRWATLHQQSRNTRHNRWVEVWGHRMIVSDAASLLRISPSTVKKRIAQGYLKREGEC